MEISSEEYGELVRARLEAKAPDAVKPTIASIDAKILAALRNVLNFNAPFRGPERTKDIIVSAARSPKQVQNAQALTVDQVKALSQIGAFPFVSPPTPPPSPSTPTEKELYKDAFKKSALAGGVFLGGGLIAGTGLLSAGVVGGASAGSLFALYGLGRLEEKIWKQKPVGFLRTLGRGVISPLGIPTGLAKRGLEKVADAGKRNVAAAKSIATGKNTVGHLTDPVRWGWHIISGTVKGFQPSKWKELKDVEKVTALPGQAITKTFKFIFDSGVSSSNKHEH